MDELIDRLRRKINDVKEIQRRRIVRGDSSLTVDEIAVGLNVKEAETLLDWIDELRAESYANNFYPRE